MITPGIFWTLVLPIALPTHFRDAEECYKFRWALTVAGNNFNKFGASSIFKS